MINFSQDIANFINYGTYNYQFDNVGNEILNPSSSVFQQVYFRFPLGNFIYNNSKILSFYNPVFTEFIPTTSSVFSSASLFSQDALNKIEEISFINSQLQKQLDSLVASSTMNSGSATEQSVKLVIINLRIQLGQGDSESDFQDVYPYLPIPPEQREDAPPI